ncbi:MAG: hypothetical protein J07HR59_00183 [Halorubrum sp. J07HR59]|jgi:hypothetical protein|nr:MAG: hypothetical protein J07HX5_01419 [halophilic archaeon J07HX5]ERH04833.1 MAG: hypothetical protein J07HR59_00183 [Halorubrum sp. J07HR59]
MSQQSIKMPEKPETATRQQSVTKIVVHERSQSEKNAKGIEWLGRGVVGLLMSGFVVIGAVAATRPVTGLGAAIVLSFISLYLLAALKTSSNF